MGRGAVLRLGGWAAVAGSALSFLPWIDLVAGELVHYRTWAANPVPSWLSRSGAVVGTVLLLAGIMAVHLVQRQAHGELGRSASVLVALSLPLFALGRWPWDVVGLHLLLIGAPLLGAAAIRAEVLPRAIGWLLAVGVPVVFVAGIAYEIAVYGGGSGDDGGIGVLAWVPVALLGIGLLGGSIVLRARADAGEAATGMER